MELGCRRGYSPPPTFSLFFLLWAELRTQRPHFKSLISLFHDATSKFGRFSAFPILRQRLPFWSLYWSRAGTKDIVWCFFARLRGSQWGGGLRLSAKILAPLRLSVYFFRLRLTKKLKINFFCFKELNIIIIHSKYFPDSDWLKAQA